MCSAFSKPLTEPLIPVLGHKSIIIQVRIRALDALDFFNLTRAERLVRVQTPDAIEQTLAAQHFVNAGDTAGVLIGGVEKSGVGISDFDSPLHEFTGNRLASHHRAPAFGV